MDDLTARIMKHEGLNQSAYKDSLGYWSIGYGKMIDARLGGKLSLAACEFILNECMTDAREEAMKLSAYKYLDLVRQGVLIELCFAMNAAKVKKFVNMLAALSTKDYIAAAAELLDSDWARTVGQTRANDLAHRMRYGRYS